MANVMFKRGTQSNLEKLINGKSFTEGTFYLTTDSDRLYFAQSASELVLLNHQVIHVASISKLPSLSTATVGDFYYAVNENVLCTKSATGQDWVQINKNTNDNDNTKTTGLTFTKSVDTNTKDITVSYTLQQKTSHIDGETTNEDPITGSFVIKGSDIASVITSTSVGVTSSIIGGKAIISATGVGADTTKKVNITGNGSVSVSGTPDNITITGDNTKYDLTSPENSTAITLDGSDLSKDTITFTNGKQISVTGVEENQINIAHGNISTTPSTGESTINNNSTFTAITSITTDNGHVTGYKTNTYTLPEAPEYSITKIGADKEGKISVTLKEKHGEEVTTVSGQELYYKVNGTNIYNGGNIDFYTKTEIDNKINGIDAMVYRGTVGDLTQTSLPTANVRNGDTYKVVAVGTYGGHLCDVGDLLIATGSETNGIIVGDIVWTYIPSGDDIDTTYLLNADNNTINLYNKVTQQNDSGVTLVAGTDAVINTSGNNITIGHAAKSVTINDTINKVIGDSERTFTAITAISNSNGHLETITPTKFTLPVDKDTTYELLTESGASNTGVIKLKDSNGDFTEASIKAGALIGVSADSSGITIKHGTPTMDTNLKDTDTTLDYSDSFNAVTSVTKDSYGHVTNYKVTKFELPPNYTYRFDNNAAVALSTVTGGYSVATTLTGSQGDHSTATFSVTSSSLKVSNPSGTTLAVDLEWGSF